MNRTSIALAAVACAVLALACSGDSALSDEAYFQAILEAKQESDSRFAEAPVPPGKTGNTAASRVMFDEFFTAQVSIAEDYHEAIADLNAPDELDRLHDLYVAAAAEYAEAFKEYRDDTLASLEEPGDIPLSAERVGDAGQTLADLCADLQDAAGERELDVDLKCPIS